HFVAEQRRVWVYGWLVPLIAVVGIVTGRWLLLLLALGIWGFNWLRTFQGLLRNGQTPAQAAHHAVFLTLSKIPNMQGMVTFYFRRLKGADMQIIEYKGAANEGGAELRVSLIGAGYIAAWHADALRATPG